MKVAVLSESSADEAAVRLLVEAVLGVQTTSPEPLTLRSRGWPAVRDVLPTVIRHLHFQTDVEGLVVVADSDRSVIHTVQHDMTEDGQPGCRVCELRNVHQFTRHRMAERVGRAPLKVAIGVAVPAVEGWYARGVVPHVNEAAWSCPAERPVPLYEGELERDGVRNCAAIDPAGNGACDGGSKPARE